MKSAIKGTCKSVAYFIYRFRSRILVFLTPFFSWSFILLYSFILDQCSAPAYFLRQFLRSARLISCIIRVANKLFELSVSGGRSMLGHNDMLCQFSGLPLASSLLFGFLFFFLCLFSPFVRP